jgi:hypothetical protein
MGIEMTQVRENGLIDDTLKEWLKTGFWFIECLPVGGDIDQLYCP